MFSGSETVFHQSKDSFLANRKSVFILGIVLLCLSLALLVFSSIGPQVNTLSDFNEKNLPPSFEHIFGTDFMGRDMLVLTLHGLSVSVFVGLIASVVSSILALLFASLAALGPRWLDASLTWLCDLMLGIPHLILLLLISLALGKGFVGVVVALSITHWPSLFRLLRSEMIGLKHSPFIQLSRRLGKSSMQIALKHMLPLVLPQLIVGFTLMFPHAILHEAALSFLGFGLSSQSAAIGIILGESMSYLSAGYWWLAVFPGFSLMLFVAMIMLLGQKCSEIFSPSRSNE